MCYGFEFAFTLRVAASGSNTGRPWVAVGRRFDGEDYGITVFGTSSGAVSANIEDPRRQQVNVLSGVIPRGSLQRMRLVWNRAEGTVRWFRNDIASGTAQPLTWAPELARGRVLVGTTLGLSVSSSPLGSVHEVSLTAAAGDAIDSWEAVGAVDTLTIAEAASLRVSSADIVTLVPSIGTIEARFATAAGEGGENVTVAMAGYGPIAQRLTRYAPAESPYTAIDVGEMEPRSSALLLTPPRYGRIVSGSTTTFYGVGESIPLREEAHTGQTHLRIEPGRPGSDSTWRSTTMPRGGTDIIRLQQGGVGGPVTEVTILEMNRPVRLNGGGQAAGHADDGWVVLPSLRYSYDSSITFPKIETETVTVTVLEVPGPGEGFIRTSRTGENLRVGDTIEFGSLYRVGWSKVGVSSVRPECKLRLRVTAPGAPAWEEDHLLRITDAPRPVAFTRFGQASSLYVDTHTRLRWSARGGDWAGIDGPYGVVPWVTSTNNSGARTLKLNVTAMVKAVGPEFWVTTADTSGSITVGPPRYRGNSSREPVLRVTGGARAGEYKATRYGSTDRSSWEESYGGAVRIEDGVALMFAFDNAGSDAASFADATSIELQLSVTSASGGGVPLQLFRPAPQPPRPGPRATASAVPAAERPDLLFKLDSDSGWRGIAGDDTNFVVANRCLYAHIPPGRNAGLSRLRSFWGNSRNGFPVVRVARMCGWHTNYGPADAQVGTLGNSGKSIGPIASLDRDLSNVEVGRGGIQVSGFSGYTCRTQRGVASTTTHLSTSPYHRFQAHGDYNYFMSGNTNGLTTFAVNPVPRMHWLWVETIHAANSINPDGTWAADGVFELHVNGRPYSRAGRLEYRVAGNEALWDALWFEEYNGGQDDYKVDRKWPFVVGPTYVVGSADPVAPPAGWNVPFVDAEGRPDTTPLAYVPDIV